MKPATKKGKLGLSVILCGIFVFISVPAQAQLPYEPGGSQPCSDNGWCPWQWQPTDAKCKSEIWPETSYITKSKTVNGKKVSLIVKKITYKSELLCE